MNRIAAFAAAALVAAGCGPAPAPPPPVEFTDLTFYWQFVDGDGNVYGNFTNTSPGCVGANVDQVVVSFTGPAGNVTRTVDCIASNGYPGATFTAVPTGNYTWTIEGWRLGLAVFQTTGAGQVFNFPSFDTAPVALYPNMDLYYDLPPGVDCTGIYGIQFELDNITTANTVVEYSSQNAFIPCRNPPLNAFTMPSIPLGSYGYRYVSAVDAPPPGGFSLYQVCGLGFPPEAPLVQQGPAGNAYRAPLDLPLGTCP
jgi:hypothetical protein